MRFIHLADVHLGAVPDRGCPWSDKRENEIWETFRRVIAGIRENPVDLLFIAGDLFHRQPLPYELKEVNGNKGIFNGRRKGLSERKFFLQNFHLGTECDFFSGREGNLCERYAIRGICLWNEL